MKSNLNGLTNPCQSCCTGSTIFLKSHSALTENVFIYKPYISWVGLGFTLFLLKKKTTNKQTFRCAILFSTFNIDWNQSSIATVHILYHLLKFGSIKVHMGLSFFLFVYTHLFLFADALFSTYQSEKKWILDKILSKNSIRVSKRKNVCA